MFKDFIKALEAWDISVNSNIFAVLFIIILIRLVFLLLGSVGVYKISKDEGINKPWLSFVLPIYPFTLGRLAERYEKKEGKKTLKLGGWLVTLSFMSFIFTVAFLIAFVNSFTTITQFALKAIETDTSMAIDMFGSAVFAIILYFVAFTVFLVYYVVYIIVLRRVFKVYNSKKATLFTFLSVIFRFLSTFFIFITALKNVEKTETEEPIGFNF